MREETRISLFKGKKIRKTLVDSEWWFSVVDICEVLADSVDPGAYWRKLKQRLIEEDSQVVTFCHGLKLEASDGKKYLTDCADTEGVAKLKSDAKAGGDIAGGARKKLEKRLGRSVVTKKNFLKSPEKRKNKKLK